MIMYLRGKTREALAKKFSGKGAEIGVADGVYSDIILRNKKVDFLYGIDPYEAYRGYTDYQKEATFQGMKKHAYELLADNPRYGFLHFLSRQAVKEFSDNSLDFVYIDANHNFKFVVEDITIWTEKVKPGGIVAGHDYETVIKAVQSYTYKHSKDLRIYGKEKNSSWMFIK